MKRFLTIFVIIIIIVVLSVLFRAIPEEFQDTSTSWNEFRETITLESLMTDLATFSLAIKKYINDNGHLPTDIYEKDKLVTSYYATRIEKNYNFSSKEEKTEIVIPPEMFGYNIYNSKLFNDKFQFLVDQDFLDEMPDALKWQNLPANQLHMVHHIEKINDKVETQKYITWQFAVFYEWPHANEVADINFNETWFDQGLFSMKNPSKALLRPLEIEECQFVIKPGAMYDPEQGESSAGFVYVDICGQHSEIGEIEIEALEELIQLNQEQFFEPEESEISPDFLTPD